VVIDNFEARPITEEETERCAESAGFEKDGKRIDIAIHLRECIGCEVCVTHCGPEVLRSIGGKAYVDLDNVDACTACNDCVKVCPVDVVSVTQREVVAAGSDMHDPNSSY